MNRIQGIRDEYATVNTKGNASTIAFPTLRIKVIIILVATDKLIRYQSGILFR